MKNSVTLIFSLISIAVFSQTVSTLINDSSFTMNHGCVVASDGTIYSTDGQGDGSFNGDKVFKTLPDGTTTLFASGISGAAGLAIDNDDNVYVSALLTGQIWKILPDGTATVEIVGTGNPAGLAFDNLGNLFIASFQNDLIIKVSPEGQGSIFANTPEEPVSIIIDEENNLYVSHETPHIITKITPNGSVSTFADVPGTHLQYMTFFGDDILVTGFNDDKIYRISPDSSVSVFAGGASGYVDGDISIAEFLRPTGIGLSPDQTILYIVEDNRIRAIENISLSISSFNKDGELKLYPNPSKRDEITLSFKNIVNGTFSMYNLTGKKVREIKVKNRKQITIKISDLSAATYLYTWEDLEQKFQTSGKLINN